jgi:hypothetical protein
MSRPSPGHGRGIPNWPRRPHPRPWGPAGSALVPAPAQATRGQRLEPPTNPRGSDLHFRQSRGGTTRCRRGDLYPNPTRFSPGGVLGGRVKSGMSDQWRGNDSPAYIPTPKPARVAESRQSVGAVPTDTIEQHDADDDGELLAGDGVGQGFRLAGRRRSVQTVRSKRNGARFEPEADRHPSQRATQHRRRSNPVVCARTTRHRWLCLRRGRAASGSGAGPVADSGAPRGARRTLRGRRAAHC